MAKYVGLTDDPVRRRAEHGNPLDWSQRQFATVQQARAWEQQMLDAGNRGGSGGAGWRFGYTYTITPQTVE